MDSWTDKDMNTEWKKVPLHYTTVQIHDPASLYKELLEFKIFDH